LLPAGQADEGSRIFQARFLISKRALMSGKPTWGDERHGATSEGDRFAPCWLAQQELTF